MRYLLFILAVTVFASCKKDKTDALVIGEYSVQVTKNSYTPIGTFDTLIHPNRIVTVKAKKQGWLTFVDGNKQFDVERTEKNAPPDTYYYEKQIEDNYGGFYSLTYYIHTDSILITEYTQGGISHGTGTTWIGHKKP